MVFDYTLLKSRAGPDAFLKDYRGYVQADAGSAFNGLFNDAVGMCIDVGCWMHARRRFVKLGDNRTEPAIARMARLFAIESEIAERLPDWSKLPCEDQEQAIRDYQRMHSVPALEAHKAWCDSEIVKLKPKELPVNAIKYGLNEAAFHFSLVASCRLNDIEPWEHLRNLIIELPKLWGKPSDEPFLLLLPREPITI